MSRDRVFTDQGVFDIDPGTPVPIPSHIQDTDARQAYVDNALGQQTDADGEGK